MGHEGMNSNSLGPNSGIYITVESLQLRPFMGEVPFQAICPLLFVTCIFFNAELNFYEEAFMSLTQHPVLFFAAPKPQAASPVYVSRQM